jgi:hypothetical protein
MTRQSDAVRDRKVELLRNAIHVVEVKERACSTALSAMEPMSRK